MHPKCFRQTKRTLSIGSGIVTVLLLALCLRMGVLATAHASGGGPMLSSASVNLQHSPVGTASLSLDTATKTLTVKITLVGLAPNSTHPAHIHMDDCTASKAEILKDELMNVSADANGQGTSTTVLNDMTVIPATGWYVKVHNGPSLATEAEHVDIACAAVMNPNGATSVSVPFAATGEPNEQATGIGTLTLTNGVLTVSLDVSGLVPNSAHAAHIHAGNCTNTAGVLYDMTPLMADANGHAMKVSTFAGVTSIPATGWDINVHYSTDLTTQTGYNPILCGNVVPN